MLGLTNNKINIDKWKKWKNKINSRIVFFAQFFFWTHLIIISSNFTGY